MPGKPLRMAFRAGTPSGGSQGAFGTPANSFPAKNCVLALHLMSNVPIKSFYHKSFQERCP